MLLLPKNILMTPFDKLPPDYQQEYKDELEKIRKKQEAEQRKLEEQRRRELERQEAKRQREIEEVFEKARKEREESHQRMLEQDWNHKIVELKQKVPEDDLVSDSYPTLKSVSVIYLVLAAISLVVGLILLVGGFVKEDHVLWLPGIFLGPSLIGYSLFLLVTAEVIQLLVNVADDIHVSNALLKRIAYPTKESKSIPNAKDMDEDAMLSYLALQDINSSPLNEDNIKNESTEVIPPPIRQVREPNQ